MQRQIPRDPTSMSNTPFVEVLPDFTANLPIIPQQMSLFKLRTPALLSCSNPELACSQQEEEGRRRGGGERKGGGGEREEGREEEEQQEEEGRGRKQGNSFCFCWC